MVGRLLVTVDTATDDKGMVDHEYVIPMKREFLVTSHALVDYRDVINRFSASGYAVMTVNTTPGKVRMIRRAATGGPTAGVVACTAFSSSGDMPRVFTSSCHAVMAARTHADDLTMINRIGSHRRPFCGRGLMTKLAIVGRRHMIHRLARHYCIVMTGHASAEDF